MPPIITAASASIRASADAAWAVLGDYANDPLWRAAVTRMDQTPPGPVHNGATALEEVRMFGRTVLTRVELHGVVPGLEFSWRAIDGIQAHGIRRIVPIGTDRCEVHTRREVWLRGADRLFQPLVAWSMARAERSDLHRAAAMIERQAAERVRS